MQGRIWPRLGAISGVLFVVLLFGPSSTGSDAQIVVVLEMIAMLFFIPFLGYLYSVLRRAEGEGGWLSATAFGAGLVDLTIKLGSIAPSFAAQQQGLDPQLHDALHKMNSVAFIVTMLPIGVMMAAVAIVVLKTRVLPPWLGLLAALTAPACWVNGMFLDAEFGPAFLLFLLWVICASVVLTLRAGKASVKATSPEAARPQPVR
ncbi:MAG: hypothetical protein M3Q71_24385 [Chloroflexota bacterium]|nr:hypothetical protein [Actinomycetota bacterium]MDP9473761.1 hypothetical protein [Chloroflexota bacterium]